MYIALPFRVKAISKVFIEAVTRENTEYNGDNRFYCFIIMCSKKACSDIHCVFAGGWDVLRSFKPAQWNQHKVLEELYSEHNVSPFFQIDVVPNVDLSDQNIILVL